MNWHPHGRQVALLAEFDAETAIGGQSEPPSSSRPTRRSTALNFSPPSATSATPRRSLSPCQGQHQRHPIGDPESRSGDPDTPAGEHRDQSEEGRALDGLELTTARSFLMQMAQRLATPTGPSATPNSPRETRETQQRTVLTRLGAAETRSIRPQRGTHAVQSSRQRQCPRSFGHLHSTLGEPQLRHSCLGQSPRGRHH